MMVCSFPNGSEGAGRTRGPLNILVLPGNWSSLWTSGALAQFSPSASAPTSRFLVMGSHGVYQLQ